MEAVKIAKAPLFRMRLPSAQARRSFHHASAELITVNSQGGLNTANAGIWLGEAHEAFALIPPDIGKTLCIQPFQYKDDLYPLIFFHGSRHFANACSPYPRLVIPQALPRQNDSNVSAATMCCYGVSWNISLDGTPDAQFARDAMASGKKLKGVLDELKNM